ncbi:DNA recombination protein RmuC [Arsukibacterium sp.]|uniref:DNA recombination protein RmuC n=1 Tax=Arsukibacterium sp. TaxID=1977258 RepID=UPI002FDA813A
MQVSANLLSSVFPYSTVTLLLLLVGFIAYWLVTNRKHSAAVLQQALLEQRLAQLIADKQQLLQLQQQLQGDYQQLQQRHVQLQTSLQEKQQHFTEQLSLIQQSKQQLKQEFELLANEILERKGKAFNQLNRDSMTQLLTPLQQEMLGFKQKIDHLHTEDTKQRSELKAELKLLQQLNAKITDEASQLSRALLGQRKVQGNWGELMLENVLDNSGLRLNIDYRREASFNAEHGRQRPDAVVFLPQGKHLIIDAKTSLSAYTRFVNAEHEPERQLALKAHVAAVKERITELSDKAYFDIAELNSPEVVFMFIPIESAYVLALQHDAALFQQALERNVLVTTPTTLLTSLNIVRQLWRFEDQNKHTAELANRAERFYQKLKTFVDSMQGVGRQLDKARESYDKALGQLVSGKGNLIKQAAEFKELGVAVKTELDPELVERARLELGTDQLPVE